MKKAFLLCLNNILKNKIKYFKYIILLIYYSMSCSVYAETVLPKESIYHQIKKFPFIIKVIPIKAPPSEFYNSEDISMYNLQITNQKTGKVQLFEEIVTILPLTAESLISVYDYNGDGFLDIAAFGLPPAASADIASTLYIFNPKNNEFFESKGIIQEGEIHPAKKGCISVEYRVNSMHYETDHYCWKNNAWQSIEFKK